VASLPSGPLSGYSSFELKIRR